MPDQRAIASPVPVPGEFEFGGKRYRFAALDTIEVITRFQAWMQQSSWENLHAQKAFLPRAEYQEHLDGLRRDILAGLYRWDSRERSKFLATGIGQKTLMLFMIQAEQKDTDMRLLDDIYKSDADAERIVRLMLELDDPNAPTPATTAPASNPAG